MAASLQHPNLVAIHEVGFCDGQHFIAMDYVPGRTLADIVRDGPLDGRRAAVYVKTVAEAIHFAHEHKILHRDLKPSNVLVDEFDAPRVTDFGLARRLDAETVLTLSGQVFGSPSYMAPEQAAARHGQVGRHTDVYALGALLYHLLTGRPPFAAGTVPATLHEVLQTDVISPRLLRPNLPRDLETICLKSLEKEPARRFATAQELADELARFLRGEPTRARPVTLAERAWRWAKRKPALAAMIGLVHLVAAVGLAGIIWQWLRAEQNATEAKTHRDVAEGHDYAAQMRLAHADYKAGKLGSARQRVEAWRRIPDRGDRPDWRGFEWRWLQRLCASSPGEVIATNASGFTAVAASPDGRSVALGTIDGTIKLIDVGTSGSRTPWNAHPGAIDTLAFIPDEANWLVSVGGDDGLLKIWDVRVPRLLASTNCYKGMLAHVTVSRSGHLLAASAPEGDEVNVWEIARDQDRGHPRFVLKRQCGGPGPSAFSPDERTLAVANYSDFRLALWDLASGALSEDHKPEIADYTRTVEFSPDGQVVATTGADGRVLLWSLGRSSSACRILRANTHVRALKFSADGKALFAANMDENLQAWDLNAVDRSVFLRGHSDGVDSLACIGHEPVLISASRDGTARRWRTDAEALARAAELPAEFQVLKNANEPLYSPPGHGNVAYCLAVSPDQRHVAVSFLFEGWTFDLVSGQVQARIDLDHVLGKTEASVLAVVYSPDGTLLALGGCGGLVVLLDSTTLQPVKQPLKVLTTDVTSLAFALGGRVLLSGTGFSDKVTLTDVHNWRVVGSFPAAGNLPREAFAVSPEGGRVAMSSPKRLIAVREIESGRLLDECPQPVRFLGAVAFSPDGKSVAFNDESGTVFLWDLSRKRPLRRWTGHRGHSLSLAFSPDGRTLASGGMDQTIRLWQPDLDQEVATLTGHTSPIFSLAFADQGNALVSVGFHSKAVLVWRAAPQNNSARE